MKVSVLGSGYVGLVSGVCLAEKEHDVVCVDLDLDKVKKINNAIPPIYEEGLGELLTKNVESRKLKATTELRDAVLNSDITLIAVGTPFDGEVIDLSYVEVAARQIGEALKEKKTYHVVVVKSTVVPGTSDEVVLPIIEDASGKKAGVDFGVGMNPEFLREGEAIIDFMFPDRIVLGGGDERTHAVLEQLYSSFSGVDILKTNNSTAEMIKYASNSLLATMISFSNEIGNLCSLIEGIDAIDVFNGVHLDKRVSPIMNDGKRVVPSLTSYLEAGCGFGGSCFPKDVKALVAYGKRKNMRMNLLDSVMAVNRNQPQQMISRLTKHIPDLRGKTISVLGLAFKPGTDDMRESPAIPIIKWLHEQGCKIKAYDPIAQHEAEAVFEYYDIEYCSKLSEAIDDVDAIMLITRWDDFKNIGQLIREKNPQPLLVDGRRMIDKNSIENYEGIGV